MALSNPCGDEVVFLKDYVSSKPAVLNVRQKYWTWWFSGRGYQIRREDGSPLFAVESRGYGKFRTFEDENGQLVFNLERNYSSQQKAWILKLGGKSIVRVNNRWGHSHLTMQINLLSEDTEEPKMVLEARATSVWDGKVLITAGDSTLVNMRCTNLMNGLLGKFKMTPPTWEVKVADGMDMALVRGGTIVIRRGKLTNVAPGCRARCLHI